MNHYKVHSTTEIALKLLFLGFDITRPEDFGAGLAKGGASLFKKTVYGFSDTLSKFTGSISKGLSVVTLDSEFQEKRRIQGSKNRPRHAVYGVTQGVSSFARSLGSGVTGLVVCLFSGSFNLKMD